MRLATAILMVLLFPVVNRAQEQRQPAEAAQEQLPPAEPARAPRLENTGKPMHVEFQCSEEDMRHAGLACTADRPCPIYLELAAIEPVGAKLFVPGNIHTESSTLYSVLLASDDSGKTWYEPIERIRSAVLDRIQFLDFQAGWIGGQIVQALPHDPFLLITTDGGATWRRRPVNEESRIGAIEQFRFDSRDSGTLWLDRTQSGEMEALYERYESMTGGESWMLREVSSRPILEIGRRAPQSATGWRLRPHAASDSYRIEKREGERWQPVASFLISISDCRPPEKPLAEPSAEPEQPVGETPEAQPVPSPKQPIKPPALDRKSQ